MERGDTGGSRFRIRSGGAFEIALQAGTLPNLHGVLAARGGRIFFERYLAGPDAARARPLGVVRFGPDALHDIRSATKSVVGLLYGIALAMRRVPAPEARLIEQFPEYAELAGDPARQLLTVRHALTMTLGTEWDELTIPYSDPRNSEIAMDRAADRYRYILERPIVEPPGVRWTYNGGATALLARLISKGTRRPLQEFAREALFAPLAIARTEWERGADGEAIAASGLRMTPRDLARIGVTALGGGRWEGQQVVPAEWLAASFSPAVSIPDGRRYGYQWYWGAVPADNGAGGVRWEETVSAIGNGDSAFSCCHGWIWWRQSRPATTTPWNNGGRRWWCCAMCCCRHSGPGDARRYGNHLCVERT